MPSETEVSVAPRGALDVPPEVDRVIEALLLVASRSLRAALNCLVGSAAAYGRRIDPSEG